MVSGRCSALGPQCCVREAAPDDSLCHLSKEIKPWWSPLLAISDDFPGGTPSHSHMLVNCG